MYEHVCVQILFGISYVHVHMCANPLLNAHNTDTRTDVMSDINIPNYVSFLWQMPLICLSVKLEADLQGNI